MVLGGADETLALFGFGVDSFIEVISAVGIWHMIQRIRNNQGETLDSFEQRSLRITGGAFYTLTVGLILMAALNLVQQHRPETTLWDCRFLGVHVVHVVVDSPQDPGWNGLELSGDFGRRSLLKACVYLSIVLPLVASAGYELTGIGSLDALGALLIAWFTWKEGREAFAKARGLACTCSCNSTKPSNA